MLTLTRLKLVLWCHIIFHPCPSLDIDVKQNWCGLKGRGRNVIFHTGVNDVYLTTQLNRLLTSGSIIMKARQRDPLLVIIGTTSNVSRICFDGGRKLASVSLYFFVHPAIYRQKKSKYLLDLHINHMDKYMSI